MLFVLLLLPFLITLVTANDSDISFKLRIACGRIAEDNLYLFSHESNLFQYWRCLNNNIILMNCPEGYQFNESDQSCNIVSRKTTYKDENNEDEHRYEDEDEGEDEHRYEDEGEDEDKHRYEDEGKDEDEHRYEDEDEGEDEHKYEDEGEDEDKHRYEDEGKDEHRYEDEDEGEDEHRYEDEDEGENEDKHTYEDEGKDEDEYRYEDEYEYEDEEIIISTDAIVAPPPCSDVTSDIVLQKHALFLEKYWKCVNTTAFEQSCPDGSHFIEERQLCDGVLFNGTRNDPQCANTDIAYLPHSFDCTKFVKCYLNESYEGECPSGFHFDKNEKKCKHAASVQCMVDTRCNNNKEFIKFLPHPTNCSKFIECYDYGQISYVRECVAGYAFNAMRQKCMNILGPDGVDCTVTEPPWAVPESVCSNVPEGDVILKRVSTDECKFYWECKGTSQTLKRCPEKLLFNEEQQLCTANTKCNSKIKKLYAWTTQPFLTSLSVYEHPMCQYDSYDRGYDRGCDRGCNRGFDPVIYDRGYDYNNNYQNRRRLFPHPRDCSAFIECIRHEAVESKCPQGLYFDSLFQKCTKFIFSSCGK